MTEHEYKEWFQKYLGEVESLTDSQQDSPFANAPKPFNNHNWILINVFLLIVSLVSSIVFAWLNSLYSIWFYSWLDEAFLSISLGLLVTLLVFYFTNSRERNIIYYTDIIPLLKKRYKSLTDAFFQHTFRLQRSYYATYFSEFYDAWHAHCNTCIVIIGFYEYLLKAFSFRPKSFFYTKADLEGMVAKLLNADEKCQKEYLETKIVSNQTYELCKNSESGPYSILSTLESTIIELEQNLFKIKYSKNNIKGKQIKHRDSP